jgi:hypothetical protein
MVIAFLFMILFHIIDEFVLQPVCLSKLKQKKFWDNHHAMYKYDYLVALVIHSLSWSIFVHIPIICIGVNEYFLIFSVLLHSITHAYIDNTKANELEINLLIDQLMHLMQIIVIFISAVISL